MNYLRCVAESAHVNLQTDEANLFARAADAKTRICLYGSKDVITSLAAFERAGGMLRNEKQREAFMRLVTAMRCDPEIDGSELNKFCLARGQHNKAWQLTARYHLSQVTFPLNSDEL